jgi:hypothetical protein
MTKLFFAIKANWMTSLTGILVALDSWGHALQAIVDSDPTTTPDWNSVIKWTLIAIGMLVARDATKTSKQSGIKE